MMIDSINQWFSYNYFNDIKKYIEHIHMTDWDCCLMLAVTKIDLIQQYCKYFYSLLSLLRFLCYVPVQYLYIRVINQNQSYLLHFLSYNSHKPLWERLRGKENLMVFALLLIRRATSERGRRRNFCEGLWLHVCWSEMEKSISTCTLYWTHALYFTISSHSTRYWKLLAKRTLLRIFPFRLYRAKSKSRIAASAIRGLSTSFYYAVFCVLFRKTTIQLFLWANRNLAVFHFALLNTTE